MGRGERGKGREERGFDRGKHEVEEWCYVDRLRSSAVVGRLGHDVGINTRFHVVSTHRVGRGEGRERVFAI